MKRSEGIDIDIDLDIDTSKDYWVSFCSIHFVLTQNESKSQD